MKKALIISTLFLAAINQQIFAQNNEIKFSGWKKTETEHFTFIYEEAQKETTAGYIKYADDAWNKISKIYALPQKKTNVYVTGRTNTVNAFTFSAPAEIEIFTNPCTLTDFTFRDNWQKLFFTHELIHIANFNFEDKDPFIPKLFGSFMNTLDFQMVNGWALEGLATVLETELTNGGRGRSPYFELAYKSLTLDNGFIPYENVGQDKEPPLGQSYVMGYLIMKSIADRYGLEALADIERNRPFLGSLEESVELVTGESPQNIYRDVRIALAKKYADERKIPEGIIISPRDLNTNYFKPAIINEDGTIICLRSANGMDNAVVKLDPSAKTGRNYIEDSAFIKKTGETSDSVDANESGETSNTSDANETFKETILFNGNFMSEDSVTADDQGRIFATLGIQRGEHAPGTEIESALFVWTQEKGLKQVTRKASIFQPSVSRNGKTLVAVQQQGMNMRLVSVNPESGEISVLLEKPGLSFIQPNVNADGTKVAFLELDDSRARIAVLELSDPDNYQILANDDEKIYDPINPTWNSDGNLTFCCNYRGRLEIFELNIKSKSVKPVLSDPIGATWAYKSNRGIYYTSVSSSGKVIKMKPENQWGSVATFEGPSPAGEIICFGALENDYPDFKPYKSTSSEDKKIKHRLPENIQKAEEANSQITEITNEKRFFSFIQPLFYMPLTTLVQDAALNHTYWGIGAGLIGIPPRTQLTGGIADGVLLTYLSYFPEMKNLAGTLDFFIPIGYHNLDFMLNRTLSVRDDAERFVESNTLVIGYTFPFINHRQGNNKLYLSAIAYTGGEINRLAKNPAPLIGDYRTSFGLYGGAGIEFYFSKSLPRDCFHSIDFVSLLSTNCGSFEKEPEFKFGFESELIYMLNLKIYALELVLKGRYTPFAEYVCPPNSAITYGGKKLDCTMPLRLIPKASLILPNIIMNQIDAKLYCEALFSTKPEDFKPYAFDRSVMTGLEIGKYSDQLEVAGGTSLRFDFDKEISANSFNLYFTFKLHWCRN